MRRDLIIGILVALTFHGGVAWLGQVLKPGPHKVVKQDDTPQVQLMEMPKLEPDEPEDQVENEDQQQAPADLAPPSQTDVPQLVQLDSFVQTLEPPPPEGLKPAASMITIPQGRPSGLGKGVPIFDPSMLDQQPQPKFRAQPQYPFEMRRAGITGSVVVEFIIDVNGDVRNPYAVKSSQREFEQAAIQAVSKWKFRPGRRGGHAVNSRAQQLIEFNLGED